MLDYEVFEPKHAALPHLVDLRSDTVSRPTPAMYERMRTAPIGDDGLDGDPSVRELEQTVAALLGKEAGLYFPTCTMANLLAVISQTGRNQQVLLERNAHMLTTERGGSIFAGAAYVPVEGHDGAMDLDRLSSAMRPGSSGLEVGMIAMETSHNNAGGAVLPVAHMKAVHALAASANIPVHIDGARIMNAAAALGMHVRELADHADSISLCLSKGLSAPVGAILASSKPVVATARTFRKMLGGTQRQAGILAAAGVEAVQSMSARLTEDHVVARELSAGLNGLGASISATIPQTNIVQVSVGATGMTSHQWVAALQQRGILTRPLGEDRLRCVTHRHIQSDDIARAIEGFVQVLQDASKPN